MFTKMRTSNLKSISAPLLAFVFLISSFLVANKVQAANENISQVKITITIYKSNYSYPSHERIIKGIICPNGMTWETNCTTHFSGKGVICPNKMTWESNCTKAPATTAKEIKITPQKTNNVQAFEISPITNELMASLPTVAQETDELSGREKIGNSLTASAVKVGSIMTGPMSIWIILLILIIILGGGYAAYGFRKKDEKEIEPVNNITPKEIPIIESETPKQTTPEIKKDTPITQPIISQTEKSTPIVEPIINSKPKIDPTINEVPPVSTPTPTQN
jgi:hypothetical protein